MPRAPIGTCFSQGVARCGKPYAGGKMPPTESQTEVAPPPHTATNGNGEQPRNQTEVYAVHGADPEVLAYAMAKYSRSVAVDERIAARDLLASAPSSS